MYVDVLKFVFQLKIESANNIHIYLHKRTEIWKTYQCKYDVFLANLNFFLLYFFTEAETIYHNINEYLNDKFFQFCQLFRKKE